jgi:hypothetical protein
VSDHEFLFTLRLSGHDRLGEMLHDLTTSVLRHVGYGGDAVAEIDRHVQDGVEQGRAAGAPCDVQFRAHAGDIDISVSQGDRRIFHTSRRLP